MPDWLPSLPVLLSSAVVVVDLGLRIAAIGIIPGNRKPSVGMAWLLMILFVPLLGLLAFAFFGRARLGERRHAKQALATERIRERTAGLAPWAEPSPELAPLRSATVLNRNLGALPVQPGNTVELFPDYAGSIAAMTAAVRDAEHFVHVEFYITAWDEVTDPFFEALLDADRRGVRVRVLLDHLGSRGIPGYADLVKRLDASGLAWRPMMPVRPLRGEFRRPDLRNHRKILVVDGRVAFTGSQNLVEPGYNKPKNHQRGRQWVELTCRLEGPVVTALSALFATDWFAEADEVLEPHEVAPDVPGPDLAGGAGVTCQVVPSGPGFPSENNLRLFNTLIYSAQQRLSLTSPYFVPDESLLYAVTTAAHRGVAVELFVSEEADQFMVHHAQQSYYQELLEAGVRIFLYPKPWVLHSKHFSVDDHVAVIGSSNMDMRSFALNYEVSVMFLDDGVVRDVRRVEDRYRSLSRELTLTEWNARSRRSRYADNAMRLTAALQ